MAKTETCPACGAEFKAGRLACPECGSDAETGWKSQEELDYSSVELPDEFDYEASEFGSKRKGPSWITLAAILALIGMIAAAILW